jgi:hypothetical protein
MTVGSSLAFGGKQPNDCFCGFWDSEDEPLVHEDIIRFIEEAVEEKLGKIEYGLDGSSAF